MEITCFNTKEVLYTNKDRNIVGVDIIKNIEIVKVISKSVRSNFSQLRSRIQLT